MACRLINLLPQQTLRIELRGGDVLVLKPGAPSCALREELLYDNHHVADWVEAGWLRQLPAAMSEVDPATAGPFASLAAAASRPGAPAGPEVPQAGGPAAAVEGTDGAGSDAAPGAEAAADTGAETAAETGSAHGPAETATPD